MRWITSIDYGRHPSINVWSCIDSFTLNDGTEVTVNTDFARSKISKFGDTLGVTGLGCKAVSPIELDIACCFNKVGVVFKIANTLPSMNWTRQFPFMDRRGNTVYKNMLDSAFQAPYIFQVKKYLYVKVKCGVLLDTYLRFRIDDEARLKRLIVKNRLTSLKPI